MLSIPIPENDRHLVGNMCPITTFYDTLGGSSKNPIACALSKIRPDFDRHRRVHLDPDIRPELRRLPDDRLDPLGYFGQDGGPQTQLAKGQVCAYTDALFLFYGWFSGRTIGKRRQRGEASTHDQHVIWGWLQVGSRHSLDCTGCLPPELRIAGRHPHVEYRSRTNNCIYVSRPELTFMPKISGSGTFPAWHSDLRLTDPRQINQRSTWFLPAFLKRGRISAQDARWGMPLGNRTVRFSNPGRGQELIFDTEGLEEELNGWLTTLFKHAAPV